MLHFLYSLGYAISKIHKIWPFQFQKGDPFAYENLANVKLNF